MVDLCLGNVTMSAQLCRPFISDEVDLKRFQQISNEIGSQSISSIGEELLAGNDLVSQSPAVVSQTLCDNRDNDDMGLSPCSSSSVTIAGIDDDYGCRQRRDSGDHSDG